MHMFNDEPEKVAVPRIYEIPDISPIKMFGSVEQSATGLDWHRCDCVIGSQVRYNVL